MADKSFYVDITEQPSEVTGRFTLCAVTTPDLKFRFIVDCGSYQEKDYDEQNEDFIIDPGKVDFAILTHNHLDHQGRFPYFVKEGFEGKIYTTKVTKYLLSYSLYDNFKIHKSEKRGNLCYDEGDVLETLRRVVSCDYNESIEVNNYIKIHFIRNGHLMGAASVLVQIHCTGFEDINIFFSGDYNNKNMFFRVPSPHKWIRELPLNLVIESTYGDMDSTEIEKVFQKNILNAVKEGKTIIIPVFSLGRAQEILYVLKTMQKKYKVFNTVPIYYDGKLSFAYTEAYHYFARTKQVPFYETKKDFEPERLMRVTDRELRRALLKGNNKCKIIVTTSGMGSYGAANAYIARYVGKENALIHFTGYCSENTLGYRLKHANKGDTVKVAGFGVVKRADVKFTKEFSAHAKADELINFLNKFSDLRLVAVNHGNTEVKDLFADRIVEEVEPQAVGVLGEMCSFRINSSGFEATLPAKVKKREAEEQAV